MIKRISFIILISIIIGSTYVYYQYNLSEYYCLESIKYHKLKLIYWYHNYKWQFIFLFFIAYSLSCFFIIPLFYLILNIVAGFIFGITFGLILVSIVNFYTTVITFLAARFLFRNLIENKFNKLLVKVNNQLNKNGILYIFFIRIFPITPFLVSNSIMGLTRINLWVYVIISQLSILPEVLLTLYVGQKLDTINSLQDIMNTKNYLIIFSTISIIIIVYWLLNKKLNTKNINNKTLPPQ